MVYSTLTNKAIAAHQLQNSLNNISSQFQLDKASSQAKDTRIKSLEDLVIELGMIPKMWKLQKILLKRKMMPVTGTSTSTGTSTKKIAEMVKAMEEMTI